MAPARVLRSSPARSAVMVRRRSYDGFFLRSPGSIPGAANSRFGGIVQAGRVLLHPAPVGERPEPVGLAATLGRLGW